MTVKQAVSLISLLLLTACAASGPTGTADPDGMHIVECGKDVNDQSNQAGSAQMARSTDTTQTADSSVTGNRDTPRERALSAAVDEMEVLTLPQLLYRLDRITTLDPEAKKVRLRELEQRSSQLSPADSYEFALLLSRKGSGNKLLKRVIAILDGLEGYAKDQIVVEILNLHRRYFKLQRQYSQERNKTIELNKKIERLKGLEQDLDKSNIRIQESLKPAP